MGFLNDVPASIPKVLWTVRFDEASRCRQVNLMTASPYQGEIEFLFAPYSAFIVLSVDWRSDPHRIVLKAEPDNKTAPRDLPNVPWM